jgi:hypothetical protein
VPPDNADLGLWSLTVVDAAVGNVTMASGLGSARRC